MNELGELETPILLTCTLCVWKAADALVEWMLAEPGMTDVRSLNPLVAETNDVEVVAGFFASAATEAARGPASSASREWSTSTTPSTTGSTITRKSR